MSVAFVPQQKGRPSPSPAQIQKMLDENSQLIQGIVDYQSKGKAAECLQYQQILHRNLVYLASIADAVPSLLPVSNTNPPPTQVSNNSQHMPPASEPSPTSSPSANQGTGQQYAPNTYPNQNQAHPYGNNVPMQNSPNFSHEMGGNFSAPPSQQGNYGSPVASSPSQPPPPQQQQQPPPPQPPIQQPPPQPAAPAQPQPQVTQTTSQDFPNSNTISQASGYNQATVTTTPSYTTHGYSQQTQSYTSSAPSQWYQTANAQNSSSHPNYPPVTQAGYTGGPVNHSFSAPNQQGYSSPGASANTTQSQNFPTSSPSPQVGFPHHAPPQSASHESNSSPTPVQQNRFAASGTYPHSGYMHYRPTASQQPGMGSPMGPPPGNVHRSPSQSAPSAPQGQNYNYEQSQTYSPYQQQ